MNRKIFAFQHRVGLFPNARQDPRIVVLDEPNSALNSQAEGFVSNHLADFPRERTVIRIARRPRTVVLSAG